MQETKQQTTPEEKPQLIAIDKDTLTHFKKIYNYDGICPISLTPISELLANNEPVVLFFDGRLYAKKDLIRWINEKRSKNKNPTSPCTGVEIKDDEISLPQPVTLFSRSAMQQHHSHLGLKPEVALGAVASLFLIAFTVILTKEHDSNVGQWVAAGCFVGFALSLGACILRLYRRNHRFQTYISGDHSGTTTTVLSDHQIMEGYKKYMIPFIETDYTHTELTDLEAGENKAIEQPISATL